MCSSLKEIQFFWGFLSPCICGRFGYVVNVKGKEFMNYYGWKIQGKVRFQVLNKEQGQIGMAGGKYFDWRVSFSLPVSCEIENQFLT